jgi:hypothetical protein
MLDQLTSYIIGNFFKQNLSQIVMFSFNMLS